jgi:hypothetical protein
MIGASILGLPLFWCPRLTARRGSKQPLTGFLNWPLSAHERADATTRRRPWPPLAVYITPYLWNHAIARFQPSSASPFT